MTQPSNEREVPSEQTPGIFPPVVQSWLFSHFTWKDRVASLMDFGNRAAKTMPHSRPLTQPAQHHFRDYTSLNLLKWYDFLEFVSSVLCS